jgi:hypothetical protein
MELVRNVWKLSLPPTVGVDVTSDSCPSCLISQEITKDVCLGTGNLWVFKNGSLATHLGKAELLYCSLGFLDFLPEDGNRSSFRNVVFSSL